MELVDNRLTIALIDSHVKDLKQCQCEAFYHDKCAFCTNLPIFLHYSVQSNIRQTYIFVDIHEEYNKELYNAGISPEQQITNKKLIQGNTSQPHEIAIELGLYTQNDLNKCIQQAYKEQAKDKKGNVKLILDLKKLAKMDYISYEQRTKEMIIKLNRPHAQTLLVNQNLQEMIRDINTKATQFTEIIIITNKQTNIQKVCMESLNDSVIVNVITFTEKLREFYHASTRLSGGESSINLIQSPQFIKIITTKDIKIDSPIYTTKEKVHYVVFHRHIKLDMTQVQVQINHINEGQEYTQVWQKFYERIEQGSNSTLKLTEYSKL